ncbi:hypothetical protein ACWDA3_22920 [Nonomuraea rubra]
MRAWAWVRIPDAASAPAWNAVGLGLLTLMTCTHAGMAVDAAVGGVPIARFAATGAAALLIALGIAAPSIRQDRVFCVRGVLGMPGPVAYAYAWRTAGVYGR